MISLKPLLALGVLAAGGLSTAVLFLNANRGPSDDTTILGIDVSHHQGPIDWPRVKSEGISFAYIKATEGEGWIDRRYGSNLQEARAAGILTGSYHFFSFCKDGDSQATNFLAHADIRKGELVPVLDVETAGNCAEGPDPKRLHREVASFLDVVERRTGRRPIIYTTQWFHWKHMGSEFDGERFWVRNLFWKPGRSIDWVFWQYAVDDLEGVDGAVDRNEFAFGESELEKWVMK